MVVITLSSPEALRAEIGTLIDDELVNAAEARALDRVAIVEPKVAYR